MTVGKNVTAGADGTLKDSDISAIREKMEDIKDDMRKSVITALSNTSTFESIIPVNFDNPSGIDAKEYSEETAAVIDEEIKNIIDACYKKATELLSANEDKLHKVAGVLLEKEKIAGDEFDAIFQQAEN